MPTPSALPVERLPDVKLAICLEGALRAARSSEVCRKALAGRLSLQVGHYLRVGDKKEAVAEFSCSLLDAATVCDLIRDHDREVGDTATNVYIGPVYKPLKSDVRLIVNGSINREIFDVQVETVEALGLDDYERQMELQTDAVYQANNNSDLTIDQRVDLLGPATFGELSHVQEAPSQAADVQVATTTAEDPLGDTGPYQNNRPTVDLARADPGVCGHFVPTEPTWDKSENPDGPVEEQLLADSEDAPEDTYDPATYSPAQGTEHANGSWYSVVGEVPVPTKTSFAKVSQVKVRPQKKLVVLAPPVASTFVEHYDRWKTCRQCDLGGQRCQIVLCRGTLPCDVLYIGEGPGACLAGDTLIEVAYRDLTKYPNGVPISQLVGKEFQVYSFNTKLGRLALGNARNVRRTGTEMTYRVTYSWWGAARDGKGGREKYFNSIIVTSNHQFLLRSSLTRYREGEDRYTYVGYKSIDEGLTIGDSIQPFYRYSSENYATIGTDHTSIVFEHILLAAHKFGVELKGQEMQVHHKNKNKWDNSFENLDLLSLEEHARLHGFEDNPMSNPLVRETHRQAVQSEEYREKLSKKMKEVLSDPAAYEKRLREIDSYKHKIAETVKKNYDNPEIYYKFLRGRKYRGGTRMSEERKRELWYKKFPSIVYPEDDLFRENHEICDIEPYGIIDVYDMEVEEHSNFAAHGIFVHNSEDTMGIPFVGPAGILLDAIDASAFQKHGTLRRAFTNLVACFPRAAKEAGINEPDGVEIEACAERLRELVYLAQPKLVVFVGALAAKWFPKCAPNYDGQTVQITHPAAILRTPSLGQELAARRAASVVTTAVKRLLETLDA